MTTDDIRIQKGLALLEWHEAKETSELKDAKLREWRTNATEAAKALVSALGGDVEPDWDKVKHRLAALDSGQMQTLVAEQRQAALDARNAAGKLSQFGLGKLGKS